jgi:hypothetical protein
VIERKVYQCEHCKKFKRKPRIYFSKNDMWCHEHNCFYNTDNRTCFTCKHNNRNYNEINDTNIGCDLNMLEIRRWNTLSETVKKQCSQWERKLSKYGQLEEI